MVSVGTPSNKGYLPRWARSLTSSPHPYNHRLGNAATHLELHNLFEVAVSGSDLIVERWMTVTGNPPRTFL